jgi:hypothetical protein
VPQQVIRTLRVHQECTIGGAVVDEQFVDWAGPCDHARLSGTVRLWPCFGVHSACTKIGYEVDGRRVLEFSRVVQPWEGVVNIPIDHVIPCDYIMRKTHKLWAAGCYVTSVWDVDATIDVIVVWGERPSPPPQPSPPQPSPLPSPSLAPDWTRWLPWMFAAVIVLTIFMMVWSGMMVAVAARAARAPAPPR